MNRWILRLADSVADARSETDEQARRNIAYGLAVLWNEVTKIPLLVLIGSLLFSLFEMLIALAFWSVLRIWMGGYHSRTWLGCFLSATLSFLSILAAARYVPVADSIAIIVLMLGGCAVLLYAPVDHPNKPIRNPVKRKNMKGLAVTVFGAEALSATLLPPAAGRIGFWTLMMLVGLMMAGLVQHHSWRSKKDLDTFMIPTNKQNGEK